MRKKTTPPTQPKQPEYPKEWVSFNPINSYHIIQLHEPSTFNGNVRVNKYRIICELIEEPIEVIHERLQKLWDECDNSHHWTPIRNKAKEYGYELQGSAGSKRKK